MASQLFLHHVSQLVCELAEKRHLCSCVETLQTGERRKKPMLVFM